jgi:ribose transport system substrate-binding protein
MKAQWTEASAYRTVSSWLRLSTSHQMHIDVIAAQDDSMAMGARKAFQELPAGPERDRWLRLPFMGCDGMPKTGQAWVRSGLLAATVVVPPNAGQGAELLVKTFHSGVLPPERTLTVPLSFPPCENIAPFEKSRAMSV